MSKRNSSVAVNKMISYVTEEVPALFEYYVYAYLVENNYEYFHLIQKTEDKDGETVTDITDQRQRMKAYNFMEGLIKFIEGKEEGKRIMKMNAYFYYDQNHKPVLFEIQKVTVDIPPAPVFPLMIYQNHPYAYLRDPDAIKREELSKNDPKK